MSNSAVFEVVIDRKVLDDKFTDEESGNRYAGQQRKGPDQKIVVYEIGSKRHQKYFERGLTPHDPNARFSKK